MSNKRNLVLYVDAELVKKTRELGFNLSKTFENHMKHLLTRYSALNTDNNGETTLELGSPGEMRQERCSHIQYSADGILLCEHSGRMVQTLPHIKPL